MQVSSIAMDSGVSLCLFKNISVGFLNECFWGFGFVQWSSTRRRL
jgi:hypothetical protein